MQRREGSSDGAAQLTLSADIALIAPDTTCWAILFAGRWLVRGRRGDLRTDHAPEQHHPTTTEDQVIQTFWRATYEFLRDHNRKREPVRSSGKDWAARDEKDLMCKRTHEARSWIGHHQTMSPVLLPAATYPRTPWDPPTSLKLFPDRLWFTRAWGLGKVGRAGCINTFFFFVFSDNYY